MMSLLDFILSRDSWLIFQTVIICQTVNYVLSKINENKQLKNELAKYKDSEK